MKKMNVCIECYSVNSRATPLMHKRECFEKHKKYICATCGRCICMYQNPKSKLGIIDFPFTTLEYAKINLRLADYLPQKSCSIFEYQNENGEVFYRIFPITEAFNRYIEKNREDLAHRKIQCFHKMYIVFLKILK